MVDIVRSASNPVTHPDGRYGAKRVENKSAQEDFKDLDKKIGKQLEKKIEQFEKKEEEQFQKEAEAKK